MCYEGGGGVIWVGTKPMTYLLVGEGCESNKIFVEYDTKIEHFHCI